MQNINQIFTEDKKTVYSIMQNPIKPLHELNNGQQGQIVSIASSNQQMQELSTFGIIPFAIVRVIDNHNHHILFAVGKKRIGMDKKTASAINVQIF